MYTTHRKQLAELSLTRMLPDDQQPQQMFAPNDSTRNRPVNNGLKRRANSYMNHLFTKQLFAPSIPTRGCRRLNELSCSSMPEHLLEDSDLPPSIEHHAHSIPRHQIQPTLILPPHTLVSSNQHPLLATHASAPESSPLGQNARTPQKQPTHPCNANNHRKLRLQKPWGLRLGH